MTTEKFSREYRLLTPESFDNVFEKPIKAASPYITILAKPNSLALPRLGFIVSKKNLKRAVWRNKFKRVIRENFRKNKHCLKNLDIVVIAKKNVLELSNEELTKLVLKLWNTISRRYKEQVVS
jgi:ribonuclease P protein component